jgi:phosphate transport system permease protein
MRVPPRITQRVALAALWAGTAAAVLILAYIIAFVLWHGIPGFRLSFLTESAQRMGKTGGVFPFIVATLYVSVIALLVATPLGVGAAIYLTEYTREGRVTSIIRFGADCLAGVPSILFGLFGFVFLVMYLDLGWSMLSGGLTLALMVLPTVIRTSEEAIRAVPREFRDVAYGLGSTRWQMVWRVMLPSALPGILTGVILSMGRCVSETAAVMLTAGASLKAPVSPSDSGRTLAYHFYILAREGISNANAYKTATVLIVAILIINFVTYWLMRRFIAKLS